MAFSEDITGTEFCLRCCLSWLCFGLGGELVNNRKKVFPQCLDFEIWSVGSPSGDVASTWAFSPAFRTQVAVTAHGICSPCYLCHFLSLTLYFFPFLFFSFLLFFSSQVLCFDFYLRR